MPLMSQDRRERKHGDRSMPPSTLGARPHPIDPNHHRLRSD